MNYPNSVGTLDLKSWNQLFPSSNIYFVWKKMFGFHEYWPKWQYSIFVFGDRYVKEWLNILRGPELLKEQKKWISLKQHGFQSISRGALSHSFLGVAWSVQSHHGHSGHGGHGMVVMLVKFMNKTDGTDRKNIWILHSR